jgi:hypothetical protein
MAALWDWLTNRSSSPLWQWVNEHTTLLWWIALISGVIFLLSLLLVPIVVARLPQDYFLRERPPMTEEFRDLHPAVRWLLLIGKNVLGGLLVLGGIAMLAAPGQGFLTLLIGLMLMNFPGKRQAEHWLLSRPTVEKVLNWIRRKRGKEPLKFPKSRQKQPKTASTGPSLKT